MSNPYTLLYEPTVLVLTLFVFTERFRSSEKPKMKLTPYGWAFRVALAMAFLGIVYRTLNF